MGNKFILLFCYFLLIYFLFKHIRRIHSPLFKCNGFGQGRINMFRIISCTIGNDMHLELCDKEMEILMGKSCNFSLLHFHSPIRIFFYLPNTSMFSAIRQVFTPAQTGKHFSHDRKFCG